MSRRYESLLNQEEALEAARLQDAAVLKLWEAMGRLDFEQAVEHLAEVRSVAGNYSSEPACLTCEITYIQCASALADTYNEAELYDLGYELALAAWEDLLQFQDRWRQIGLPSEGSKARLALVYTMASIKWSCPTYREHWPSFEFMYEQFHKAATRLIEHQSGQSSPAAGPELPPDVLDLMQLTGTALAKLGYLHGSPELEELIAFLASRLALPLPLDCKAFEDPHREPPDNDKYWDFEIAKMIVLGTGGIADYQLCSEHRRRIRLAALGYSAALEQLWAKERQHFMRGLALAPVSAGGADQAVTTSGRDKLNA